MSKRGRFYVAYFSALAVLFFLLGLLSARDVQAAERWTRAVAVAEVAVEVHVVTYNELRDKQQPGRKWARESPGDEHRRGYAELYRNRETGAYTCHVYVTRDATAEDLAHERRHCEGWSHT